MLKYTLGACALALGLAFAGTANAQPQLPPKQQPDLGNKIILPLKADLDILKMYGASKTMRIYVENKGFKKSGPNALRVDLRKFNPVLNKWMPAGTAWTKVPPLDPKKGTWVSVQVPVVLKGVMARAFVDATLVVPEMNTENKFFP
jgi:hypothetical protein